MEIKRVLGNFSRWKDLGLNLGLRASALDVIEKDHNFVEDRLREVLLRWLKRIDNIDENVCPTWSQLVNAVEPMNRALSHYIRERTGKYVPVRILRISSFYTYSTLALRMHFIRNSCNEFVEC